MREGVKAFNTFLYLCSNIDSSISDTYRLSTGTGPYPKQTNP